MSESNGNGNGKDRLYWWLIWTLSGISAGAGSNWITSLQQVEKLSGKVEVISVKLDYVIEQNQKQANRP